MRSETPPTKKATESSHREPWVSTTPGLSLFFAACYSVKCLSQGKFLHITERALLPTFLNRLAPIGVKVEEERLEEFLVKEVTRVVSISGRVASSCAVICASVTRASTAVG